MLALSNNVAFWQGRGWSLLHRVPALTVKGPKGEASMQLMGKGEPIPGASSESWSAVYVIDGEADLVTGLKPAKPARTHEVAQ
jgi:hypothetical protein